ncbi:MAG: DUF6958 family protein [Bacteroidota bacterium]
MKEQKILTQHPAGKRGVNISLAKYDQVKDFILETIRKKKEITFESLSDLAVEKLTPAFEGKVLWYVVTVKLDLEARKLIERIPKTSPHKLRLSK